MLSSSNYNSYSPTLTGGNASGTWGINITGSASTATSASNSNTVGGLSPSQFFNNMGNNHSTYTDFNSVPGFGTYYVQGSTNSPTGISGNQFYGFTIGLGNEYPYGTYGSQIYYPRRAQNGDTYIYVRDMEAGSWTSWTKVKAGYADTAGSVSSISATSATGIQTNYLAGINTTTPGQTTYGIAFSGSSSPDNAQGITWGWSGTAAQAGIYVQSSGSYGTKMYFGTTDSFATGSKTSMSIDHVGVVQIPRNYLQSDSSLRAPIFYESTNTNFYVNPEVVSSLYGVAIRGDQSATDTSNQIFFWSAGNTTTSAIGFKASGGAFPNPTGFGDGYNTYLTMDTAGRGWVFRQGQGGSDFNAVVTSGWITNNGTWQSNGSMRAPIFYDSNDTSFYTDQASGSSHRFQILRGSWNGSPFGVAEQFTIRTNYPSYCLRNTDTGSYWLVHHAADQTINWYGGAGGVDGSSWNRNLYLDMSGNLTARNNITAYSDVRLKTNIREIDNPLEKVKKLRGVYFNWKETGILSVGMIAQEVELVFPELVLTSNSSKPGEQTSKETKSLDYSKIVSVLVEAIKEQDNEIVDLKTRVTQLEALIEKLIKE
jgi:hypothetical protein